MKEPKRYVRRVIDALMIRYTGDNAEFVRAFAGPCITQVLHSPPRLVVQSPSGENSAAVGDFIAQNPTNPTDFYVVTAENAEKLYILEPS